MRAMYALLKSTHVILAYVTIAGFVLRGYWMAMDSDLSRHRVTRIAPHVIDTVFLLSGIGLLFYLALQPTQQLWLLAKFVGLVAYIVLGMFIDPVAAIILFMTSSYSSLSKSRFP